jgi:DNA-binding Lrp family transcriptional regulator
MKDEVCLASVLRMSRELRITPKTFSKYLKKLVEDGFIKDLTPDILFSRHLYICTEKIHEETEKWLAERELEDARQLWYEGAENEMKPTSTKVDLEGNGSLPSRDQVPPQRGPGTYKDRSNIATNKGVKDIYTTAEDLYSNKVGGHSPAVSVSSRDSASVKNTKDWNPQIPALDSMSESERQDWAVSVRKRCWEKKRGYTAKELAALEKYKLPIDIRMKMCVGGFLC